MKSSSPQTAQPEAPGNEAAPAMPVDGRAPHDVFRKTVKVLHSRPREPLTLVQKKLGNAWIKHAIKNTPDEKGWWEIPLGKLREEIDFPSSNTKYLKEAARALVRIAFEWDLLAPESKRVEWQTQVLFPAVAIADGVVRFKISDDIYEELHRPEIYALIDMAVVRRLKSVAAMCVWEYCVRFENLGHTPLMPWRQFRDVVLGDHPGEKILAEYKYLKSRVLAKAIKEINEESDHEIELRETKSGRSIASIQFLVRRKNAQSGDSHPEDRHAVMRMIKLGLLRTEAKRLAASHSLRSISGALDYTESRLKDPTQPKIEQPAAYFRKALEEGYGASDDGLPQSAAASEKKQQDQFDIRAAFQQHRIEKARAFYAELDAEEKRDLLDRYNGQQEMDKLRVKSRLTKIAEVAFMTWLARETWGEPVAEDLLNFSATLLAQKSSG